MQKRSLFTLVRKDPLLATAAGLAAVTLGVFAYQKLNNAPPKSVYAPRYQPLSVHEALTTPPKGPAVPNTACGPEKTFRNVSFHCVGDKPLGVQIGNVFVRFANDRTGEGDGVCPNGRNSDCRDLDVLNEDEKAGFDWWRNEAYSRYRPQ